MSKSKDSAFASIFPHPIPYFAILDRYESPGHIYLPPRPLYGPAVSMLRSLPQSFLQLNSPSTFFDIRAHIFSLPGLPVVFIFSDSISDISKTAESLPIDFAVLLIESESACRTNFAPFISNEAFICPLTEAARVRITRDWKLRPGDRLIATPNEMAEGLSERGITLVSARIQRTHSRPFTFRSGFPNFRAIENNTYLTAQLHGGFIMGEWIEREVPHDTRGVEIVKSCASLDSLRKMFTDVPSSLIVTVPHINARAADAFAKSLKDAPAELAPVAKALRILARGEQDSASYDMQVDAGGLTDAAGGDGKSLSVALQFIGEERGKLMQVLDNTSFLHATFHLSPTIRTPLVANRLNADLIQFEPHRLARTRKLMNWREMILEFGSRLADTFPEGFNAYIQSDLRQVVVISDLPVEWAAIDGVPLGFLQDTCRIPQTPLESIMAQFVANSTAPMRIPTDLMSRTLLVCCAPGDADIKIVTDKVAADFAGRFHFAECDGLEELKKVIRDSNPFHIVFFTHGIARQEYSDSALQLGNGVLTGRDIVRESLTAPIVTLVACNTAPAYGYLNPIAQAFFEAGARTVTSSLVPISIGFGAAFTHALLSDLDDVATKPRHVNWLGFISGLCRRLLFVNSWHRIAKSRKFKKSNFLTPKANSEYLAWQKSLDSIAGRRSGYNKLAESVIQSFPLEFHEVARNVINLGDAELEALFFTHLGRADLLTFESAFEKQLPPK